MKRVLLVDIPVVPVALLAGSRSIVKRKLTLEAEIRHSRLPGAICPRLPYTRGLLTIGAALSSAGTVVDYVVWSDPEDRARIKALSQSADVVGITCMTSGHAIAESIVQEIKAVNRRATVVIGGHHATALGVLLLDQIPMLDGVVLGDGLSSMKSIVDQAPNISGIPGVCTRRSSSATPAADSFCLSPMPGYNLLFRPLDYYAHSIRTCHGCPYGCRFCLEGLTWARNSLRSLKAVYAEIAHVLASVPKGTLIHFSDPVFDLEADRTKELCEWLELHASGYYFSVDTRIDLLTPERARLLRRAGCRYLRVGLESLVPSVLVQVNKGLTPAQGLSGLRMLRETVPDVIVHAYWITGLPGSTRQTAQQSIQDAEALIADGLVDVLSNKILVPYPGSPYYRAPHANGLVLLQRPWDEFDRMSMPVYRLSHVSERDIYDWFCTTEAAAAKALERRLRDTPRILMGWTETYKALAYMGATEVYSAPSVRDVSLIPSPAGSHNCQDGPVINADLVQL